jgi:hypothetical protein
MLEASLLTGADLQPDDLSEPGNLVGVLELLDQ